MTLSQPSPRPTTQLDSLCLRKGLMHSVVYGKSIVNMALSLIRNETCHFVLYGKHFKEMAWREEKIHEVLSSLQ